MALAHELHRCAPPVLQMAARPVLPPAAPGQAAVEVINGSFAWARGADPLLRGVSVAGWLAGRGAVHGGGLQAGAGSWLQGIFTGGPFASARGGDPLLRGRHNVAIKQRGHGAQRRCVLLKKCT